MSDERIHITKVEPRPIQRLEYDEPTMLYRRAPSVDEVKEPPTYELTSWQKVRLMPYVFQIFRGVMMKDAKTTISGIVKAIFIVLSALGVGTGHLTEAMITGLGYIIADIYQAVWTADKKD